MWTGSVILSGLLGGYLVFSHYNKPILNPNTPSTSPVEAKPVERELNDITLEKALGIIHCYDTSDVNINWDVLKQDRKSIQLGIKGNLCERSFEQEATIPIIQTSSGNWKLGLGVGLGTAATIGALYGGYKLYKLLH